MTSLQSNNQYLIKDFSKFLSDAGKQQATIESYTRDAQTLVSYLTDFKLDLREVSPEIIAAFKSHLTHDLKEKPNTVRRMLIGAKQFYRFLEKQQDISSSPMEATPIPKREEIFEPTLTRKTVDQAIAFCENATPPKKAVRDAAVISLLAFEGIKASELINLKWEHLKSDSNQIVMYLTIPGSKKRTIKLSIQSNKALTQYKTQYAQVFEQYPQVLSQKYLFIGFQGRGGGKVLPKLTRHGLKHILYEVGSEISVDGFNTEKMRHFCISFLLDEGFSVEQVMDHLGLKQPGIITKHLN